LSTYTHKDHDFRLTGAKLVLGVRGLLVSIFGGWISQVTSIITQIGQRTFVPTHDKYRLTTPGRHWPQQLTGFKPADINGYWSAGSKCLGAGIPGAYERYRCANTSDRANCCRGANQKASAALVYSAVIHKKSP
jgi:hypothetical protein